MLNKPVITYSLSSEANHIEVLGQRGIYYSNQEILYDILNNLDKYKIYNDYDTIYSIFNPDIIMNKFQKVFLT